MLCVGEFIIELNVCSVVPSYKTILFLSSSPSFVKKLKLKQIYTNDYSFVHVYCKGLLLYHSANFYPTFIYSSLIAMDLCLEAEHKRYSFV